MPTEHTLLLALFGLLALTVGLLALLIYLVLSDRHRRGAEGDDLCDALLEGVAGAKREIEGTVAKTDARLSAGLSSLITYSTTEQKRSSESVERFAASARGDLARMNETLAKEFLSLQSMVDERFAKVLQTNAGAQEALGAKLSAALAEVRGTVDASLERCAQKMHRSSRPCAQPWKKSSIEPSQSGSRRVFAWWMKSSVLYSLGSVKCAAWLRAFRACRMCSPT